MNDYDFLISNSPFSGRPASELLGDFSVEAAAVVLFAIGIYKGINEWAEKVQSDHIRGERLVAYRRRHKWRKSDIKNLRSIGVNEYAQRRMAKLKGKGRPVVKPHRPLGEIVNCLASSCSHLFRDEATSNQRRSAIKAWPWWKHYVEALYRGEHGLAVQQQIRNPHDHAERAVAGALRVSQGTVRAVCGRVRAMRRDDEEAANFPPMLVSEYERWMEEGQVPDRFGCKP